MIWYHTLKISFCSLRYNLQVKTCGFPPLEDREKSSGLFSGIDFFGSGKLAKEETVSFSNAFNWINFTGHNYSSLCYNFDDLFVWYVSLTFLIAETCRAGNKGSKWHVCHPFRYLAGQWGCMHAIANSFNQLLIASFIYFKF